MRPVLAALCLLLLCLSSALAKDNEPLTVLAAASLSDALTDIQQAWQARTGSHIRLSLAASSTLARQIEAGAPADIFISASSLWVDYLDNKKLIKPGTRCALLGNRLVLIAPTHSPIWLDDSDVLPDLVPLLGKSGRLSIGDPQHVPAGIYAREALIESGQWQKLEHRLAPADHVRAALALVARGETPLGIVYETDARAVDSVRILSRISQDLHSPIRYDAAIVDGTSRDDAMDFLAFMGSVEGKSLFRAYGFRSVMGTGSPC